MKLWKWDRFAILLIVCGIVLFVIIEITLGFSYEFWPLVLLIALLLAAGITFVIGLLNVLDEQKEEMDHLRKRIRELEKKLEDK